MEGKLERLTRLAAEATLSVDGVAALAQGKMEGLTEKVGVRHPGKGIRAEIREDRVTMEIPIIVDFGCRIPELARSIQKRVKKVIEDELGHPVLTIDVLVLGVRFNQEKT